MRDWNEFVHRMEGEINWHDQGFPETQSPRLERILAEAAGNVAILQERTQAIAESPTLLQSLSGYCEYPRLLMDKFVVYIDREDRFRIRMHRFRTRRQNGKAVETIHSHKWHCSTVILGGSYTERQFSVGTIDTEDRSAQLELAFLHTLAKGSTNSVPAGTPHQIVNESDDTPCITLFVRGPALRRSARIFDIEKGTFYETYAPLEQLKAGLTSIGRLDPNFHF